MMLSYLPNSLETSNLCNSGTECNELDFVCSLAAPASRTKSHFQLNAQIVMVDDARGGFIAFTAVKV